MTKKNSTQPRAGSREPRSEEYPIGYIAGVLGLDLSLTGTGWARMRSFEEAKFATISPGPLRGMDRLDSIAQEVLKQARTGLGRDQPIRFGPLEEPPRDTTLILIEGYSFGSRAGQAFSLGELGGVVRHCLWKDGFRWLDIPPSVLKKFVTGRGNAPKEVMMMHCLDRFGFLPFDNNQADAISLMMLGRALAGGLWTPSKLLKPQRELVASLREEFFPAPVLAPAVKSVAS